MTSIRRVATVLLPLLAVALLVRTAVAGRRELGDLLDGPRWSALAAMVACAVFAMVWIAVQWEHVMRAVSRGVGTSRAVALYFVGEIGKYVPGGIWPVVGRAELVTRPGPTEALPRPVAYAGVLMSLAYLFLAGLLCAGAAAGFALSQEMGSAAPLLLLALLPVGLGALHPAVCGRVFAAVLARLPGDRASTLRFPAWRTSIALVLRYVPAWFGVVGATWFAARALDASPGLGLLALAACLGWVAGFLLLPAPGGIGAREAVFAAVLGTTVSSGRAAAMAVLARLAFVLVDAGGAAVAAVWLAAQRRRSSAR